MQIDAVESFQWGKSPGVRSYKFYDINLDTGNWYARRLSAIELALA